MAWHRGIVLKSKRELSIMRTAGRINAQALLAALRAIQPGATTMDVDTAAAEVLQHHNARPAFLGYPGPYPYPAVTTVSVNEELVHGIPGKRRLREGDIVSVDCGCVVDGFVADSAFTVGVGEISEEAQRLIDVTENALFVGIQAMQIRNKTGDISAAIQAYVEGEDLNVVREYTGHGVGRNMHEDPQVPNYGTAGRGVELRAGMTIALEPMVLTGSYETKVLDDQWTVVSKDGALTAHFEHTVAITQEGPLVLTTLDHDLDDEDVIRYNKYFVSRMMPVIYKE